ncbi:MAG: glycosyltransferase family 4 protein [Chitinophagaceae bacterium]|nr:glycosyltransferase family 4 protein [Chitinophagaceae bacterium]
MKIGFDAKRAFQNSTGLGNYSRSLIAGLAAQFPEHQYTLFAPKQTGLFNTTTFTNIDIVLPQTKFDRSFPALWRRSRVVKDISRNGIDIFHGLSNELPAGIEKSGAKSVITVHDLIFEKYPETYHFEQRYTHRWKMKQACEVADAIIAASSQTKQDLIGYYKIPADKIFVCYQNCSPLFERQWDEEEKNRIKKKYQLPDQFFLFVSSVTKRKKLIDACKALTLLKNTSPIPLVVIGDGKKEKEEVKKYLIENKLDHQVIFLNELLQAKEAGFTSSADFPGIYQQALALVYPSVFEGFGIPLLEAMWSGLPVISSNSSCLPEVTGDAALYFSPGDVETLAAHMLRISKDTELINSLKVDGLKRAVLFTSKKHAESVMKVYQQIS